MAIHSGILSLFHFIIISFHQILPQLTGPIGSDRSAEAVDAQLLGNLAVLLVVIDEECLIRVVARLGKNGAEDLGIGLYHLQVAREPNVVEELFGQKASLEEIALAIAPMHLVGVGEHADLITLGAQLLNEVETIGRNAICHRAEGMDDLTVGGRGDGIATVRSGMDITHDIAELSQGVLATLHIVEHTLLMGNIEHLLHLGDAYFLEFLDTAVRTKVEKHAAEVENDVLDHREE